MKKIIPFFLLLLLSCSSQQEQVKTVTEKFIKYLSIIGSKNRTILMVGEAVDYKYSKIINGECEADVVFKRDDSLRGPITIEIKLRKYKEGWAVYQFTMKDLNYHESQTENLPFPAGNKELDMFISNSNVQDNISIQKVDTPNNIVRPPDDSNVNTNSISNKSEVSTVDTNIMAVERKEMLDVLRTSVEVELRQDVKFIVRKIKRCGNWVLIMAKPIRNNGSKIDYSMTEYQKQIDDGAFDEGVTALLKFKNNKWLVAEYVIGATDSPINEWIEKYDLEACKNNLD